MDVAWQAEQRAVDAVAKASAAERQLVEVREASESSIVALNEEVAMRRSKENKLVAELGVMREQLGELESIMFKQQSVISLLEGEASRRPPPSE